jgi:hypothetical protein
VTGVTGVTGLAAWDVAALAPVSGAVTAAAAQLANGASALTAVGTGLFDESLVAEPWVGLAAQGASAVLEGLVSVLRDVARGADDLGAAVAAGAGPLAAAVLDLRARLAAPALASTPSTLDEAIQFLLACRAVEDAGAGVRAADAAAARSVQSAALAVHALLRRWRPMALRELLSLDGFCAILPTPGSDPELVADWWAGRTPEERAGLLVTHAAELGALDGLPADVRDAANRMTVLATLTSYAGTRSALVDRLRGALAAGDPHVLWATVDALRRLDARHAFAETVDKTLTAYAGRTDSAGRPLPVQLLLADPDAFGGHGRAAVAFGDVDAAAHVAFVVPGFRQRVVPEFWRSSSDAWRLYAEVDGEGPAGGVATVSWFGYDVPMGADVAFAGDAAAGAALLAGAVRGVRAARRGGREPHVTVVAHSYGSTTAGIMLRDNPGVGVDDLVAIGSPGLAVRSASDLHLQPGHVWVGAASGDPVDHLARFGPDPASAAFGAKRFDAETAHRSWWDPFEQHSHYFDTGEPSLAGIAAIVGGRPSDVLPYPGRQEGSWADAA